MWKTRQRFFTMTLETDGKGCSAAWQRVCFGYKMSRVQILSSLSLTITYRMSSNKGSIETDSNWTYILNINIYQYIDIVYACKMYWGHITFFMIIKRSQFSSVERGSPKPDVVGSNPTERDSILVRLRITLK